MASNIGFIGLGIMGKPMARNLMKAGHSLVVHNRNPEPVEELALEGASKASTSAEVASRTDIVITMLPDSADSEDVILGKEGVLEGARQGSVIIDMSSIAPLVSIKIAAEAEKAGVDMLDAPVSGGEPRAIDGTLAIMVGGKEDTFEKLQAAPGVHGLFHRASGAGGGRQHGEAGQPDHCSGQHRGPWGSAGFGQESGNRPGPGLQRHTRRSGRQRRHGSQGPVDYERRFRPGVSNQAPSEGPS